MLHLLHYGHPSRKEEEGPPQRKRKRDEVEAGYERRRLGAPDQEPAPPSLPKVGVKRKALDDAAAAAAGAAEVESFDDESKLLRTVFVGILPLRTKKKALTKEFTAGEIESIRIRSVPLGDTKIPKKGAVIKGKINDSVDKVFGLTFGECSEGYNGGNYRIKVSCGGTHVLKYMHCPA